MGIPHKICRMAACLQQKNLKINCGILNYDFTRQ